MNNATSSEVYGKMQDVFIKMDHGGDVSIIHQTFTLSHAMFFLLNC